MTTREDISAALFALVSAAANARTSSRRLRLPQSVNLGEMPALFFVVGPEQIAYQNGTIGITAKHTRSFEVALYTADPQENSITPSQQLNTMIDAIEAALRPGPAASNKQTLGGLVVSARIDGEIKREEGLDLDGTSAAVIPIVVICP